MFESGAILLYLADKTGQLHPARTCAARIESIQWLFWQMGGSGPWPARTIISRMYAPEKLPYAIDRYVKETGRLYGVLNRRLADREFIAGDYSIADMACYPWIMPERQGQNIDDFPHLKRWREGDRRAAGDHARLRRSRARSIRSAGVPHDDAAKKVLFGQDQDNVR